MIGNTNNTRWKVKIIINLGVTKNFILEKLAKRKGFLRVKKKDFYNLAIVDRSLLLSRDRKVIEETMLF